MEWNAVCWSCGGFGGSCRCCQVTTANEQLIILMGLGNYGSAIASRLQQHGWHLLAVDSPSVLTRFPYPSSLIGWARLSRSWTSAITMA